MKKTKLMQIMLLPAKKKEIGSIVKSRNYNSNTGNTNDLFSILTKECDKYNQWKPQHLYLVSNNEVKLGDWWVYIDMSGLPICIFQHTKDSKIFPDDLDRKIEVTTNEDIISDYITSGITFVPSIPKSFIDAYIKSNGTITEVSIEMIEDYDILPTGQMDNGIFLPKTRSDNTAIIHQSKTYTRDEVISFIKDFRNGIITVNEIEIQKTNKWIEENL